MRIIKREISKCILILSISIVSSAEVFKFDDLKKEEIIANGLNEIEEIRAKSSKSPNTVENKNDDSKLNNYRRSPEIDGYRYKKLVKRIVPHNYDVKEFEYDHKFNTLFKPLLRIHKKNLKPEYSSDQVEATDLVYVLDDEKFDDAPEINKDESLLKPFSTKSAHMEYIPREYVLNNNAIELPDLNDSPFKQRFKLVDDQIENKHVEDDRSDQLSNNNELKYRGSMEDSLDPIKAELYNILQNKKAPYVVILHNVAKRALKPRKKQQLSMTERWRNDKVKLNNRYKYITQQLKQRKQTLSQQNEQKLKNEKDALLFGPVGGIVSKQYDKEIIESLIQRPLVAKQELRLAQPSHNQNKLPDVLKVLIRNERDNRAEGTHTSSELQMDDRINSMFVGVGHINSKQITLEERLRQANEKTRQKKTDQDSNRKPRSYSNIINKNKLALLNELSKYKVNYLIEGNKDKNIGEKLRTLTHVKSGEEEEVIQMLKKTLDDDEVTTKAPDNWRPNYPFWNYWTYDKQIEQDDCKGQLVQHGKVCVGAWARKSNANE